MSTRLVHHAARLSLLPASSLEALSQGYLISGRTLHTTAPVLGSSRKGPKAVNITTKHRLARLGGAPGKSLQRQGRIASVPGHRQSTKREGPANPSSPRRNNPSLAQKSSPKDSVARPQSRASTSRLQTNSSLTQKLKSEFVPMALSSSASASNSYSKYGFTSPPLLPGLVSTLESSIGPQPRATSIQSMSLEHFLGPVPPENGSETLLASETGSGKSIAFLLPVLQSLKHSERLRAEAPGKNVSLAASTATEHASGPRAIILCPTHELCRQIAKYAKILSHDIKLRIVCASSPNQSSKNSWQTEGSAAENTTGRPIDVLVATPSKILTMLGEAPHTALGNTAEAKMSLDSLEWLVIDETDVMFDRSFIGTTEAILKAAKGTSQSTPFNLILSSATIPVAVAEYLKANHPRLTTLSSPNIHKLPRGLRKEYVQITGNMLATIHNKIKAVWAENAAKRSPGDRSQKSKVLIFCNEVNSAERLHKYLNTRGIESLFMAGTNASRLKGSNNHLAGFLNRASTGLAAEPQSGAPRILITTSLLSRGLDFDPSVTHVFAVDEPRSAIDFLHRAGRTARAGNTGTVVLFEKGSRGDRRRAAKNFAETPEQFGKVSRARRTAA